MISSRLGLFLCLLWSSQLLAFKHSSGVEISTDNLRRGISITERSASVKVFTHLDWPYNFFSTFDVANSGEKDAMGVLIKLQLGYYWDLTEDWRLTPQIRAFYNPFAERGTTVESGFKLTFLKDHSLNFWYSHQYFHQGTYTFYTALKTAYFFTESLKIKAHVGYNIFGDPDKAGQSNYLDGSIGLWHLRGEHSIGITFSTTNRSTIDTIRKITKSADDWSIMGAYRYEIKS